MKLFVKIIAITLLFSLIILLETSCHTQSSTRSAAKAPADPNVVAKIGDYIITKEALEKRLLTELYPKEYMQYPEDNKPADAKSVLMEMIAEKAMIMEAREQGYPEDDSIKSTVERFSDRRLTNIVIQKYLQQMKDKITATESEIEQKAQADPNANRLLMKRRIENEKARNIINEYYKQLYEKFHIKKLSENYAQAVQIHERLLNNPKTPQKLKFIRFNQIKNEMTPEEKNIVLATYDYGKVTMEDLLNNLCESSPPSRPKDLNTTKGIDQFMDRVLAKPVYIAEAELLKLDEDETFLNQVKEYEERILLSKVNSEIFKQAKESSDEQLVDYFNNNKELFKADSIKIDLIWCQDLKTARQAKAELAGGKDFDSVKQQFSLDKKSKPYNTYPDREGLFWKDLKQADPNDIIGPIKGFYRREIKWRVVKILGKTTGEPKEYSTNMNNSIKNMIMSDQRVALLAEYRSKMLKKYPHEIYYERIKDIDPLDIP